MKKLINYILTLTIFINSLYSGGDFDQRFRRMEENLLREIGAQFAQHNPQARPSASSRIPAPDRQIIMQRDDPRPPRKRSCGTIILYSISAALVLCVCYNFLNANYSGDFDESRCDADFWPVLW